MCGIAGIVDLQGGNSIPRGAINAMADALLHRGPDEQGFLELPSLALASRRLSIVGLADGQQPISNQDGSITAVFNGELFEHASVRSRLEGLGHRFVTHCDTEIIPHLWEQYQEGMFEHLRGQFALALWDRRRQQLILARDRFGICPLFWSRQTTAAGDRLVFASEIKGILASGLVAARPEPRGLNHLFTFLAMPGPLTCFEGIHSLLPGHFLSITPGRPPRLRDQTYWEIDFPDQGQEVRGEDPKGLVDAFEKVMLQAVERRLRADVPVVSYLSGGVDSSLVVAMASRVLGRPIPTFTIRIQDPALDETSQAGLVARHVGATPFVVNHDAHDALATYPELIRAAESPVIDTSCAALLMLARSVNAQGYKVALTGEGADEWLAGYPWYKIHKLAGYLDAIPGLRLTPWLRRAYLRFSGAPKISEAMVARSQDAVCGPNPWLDFYGLLSLSKLRFYGPAMRALMEEHIPYADLGLNQERMRRWHPLNRGLYVGARVHLPGLLLNAKGDRVAMNSSVETRYPFLDEDVFSFLAGVHPRWKLRGFRDKHLLRLLAERWLPTTIARRRKAMFRAPFDSFHADKLPPFVDQLLSPESLHKTGYFDPAGVQYWRSAFRAMRPGAAQRMSVEMGLAGVVSTQLWHHTFIDPTLADLPGASTNTPVSPPPLAVNNGPSALAPMRQR
jgi:asparagine synthase (glutamine-hydrolysing)